MQTPPPRHEIESDGSLRFFRDLEEYRNKSFEPALRGLSRGADAYFVDLILFARFLNATHYTDIVSLNRDLLHFVAEGDSGSIIQSVSSSASGLLSRYKWHTQTYPSEGIVGPVEPWILGYIYERWTNNRETGSYFTPDRLADSIFQYALYQWLILQSDAQFEEHDPLRRAIVLWRKRDVPEARKIRKTYEWILDKIDSVRIVDLSVGGGAFLVSAAKSLFELTSFSRQVTYGFSGAEARTVVGHIFKHNIFGLDINEIAVHIAKMRLWLLASQLSSLPISDLPAFPALDNIGVANSLIALPPRECTRQTSFLDGDGLAEGVPPMNHPFAPERGFDICVGNPPFVALSQGNNVPGKSQFISDWNERHPKFELKPTSDLSNFFILKGAEVLGPNGFLAYITSRNFFDTRYGQPVREFLASSVELCHIFTLHEHPFVQKGLKVKANTVILSLARREPARPARFYHLMDWNRPLITILGHRIDRDQLFASQNWTQTLFRDDVRDSLRLRCRHVLSEYATARMGIKTGMNTFFLLKAGSKEERELSQALSAAQLPKVAKNSRSLTGYVLSPDTEFRLLNLKHIVRGIDQGYQRKFASPVARYIYEAGIKYGCATCQALAGAEHIAHPELFPHAGMCDRCEDCASASTACDRPIDRLSVQGRHPAWYALNLTQPPLIAVQCIVDTEIGVYWNDSNIYATDQFQVIDSTLDPDLAPIIFMYLTSRISHVLLEGTGMHRARYDGSFMLKIQVNHLSQLPCPVFELLNRDSRERVSMLFRQILKIDSRKSQQAIDVRDEVDRVFLELLGYSQTEIATTLLKIKSTLEGAIHFRWEKTTDRASNVEGRGD